jgi:hypothetical protein
MLNHTTVCLLDQIPYHRTRTTKRKAGLGGSLSVPRLRVPLASLRGGGKEGGSGEGWARAGSAGGECGLPVSHPLDPRENSHVTCFSECCPFGRGVAGSQFHIICVFIRMN